ncbi:nitronate monooxygenase [Weissella soli]|jgi:enoyl-[acyl-carrier protein] reductase II|uniref:Probable nitronate monooxygenase n=1 Tax=Weissella soli TaxID=155866 RepID=A0A288Q7Y1_9LACO|nr:nitronate monooxygenase [Weissella soli]AOT56004.1 Enoyl-[acyl-carrier-protein] reductase (NADH) [Weissella soli]MCT8394623.1 enoyl-[acyl-carrier-protein] reductase FabK [Weissella soli]NKY83902.1 enoyl-[acyl-carrier-protein] reductase FabK [Weissella soli]RDL01608.1 enoyl-[acyl-carrier protein] reductase II [Weissella soli]GEN93817.1 2-nitropropane dioxygenase [Weissella soli]
MAVNISNPLFEKLGMKYPIIQGGMAWAGTGHLAGSVSEAGGLGIIGTGYWHAEQVRAEIHRAREVTDKPFGVNVMLMSRHIREVFDVIIEEGIKVVATGAGDPSPFLEELHQHDIIVIPVVPSVAMARMMEKKGVDAVVAEGMESGGHIGMLTTMTLVPQVVDAVSIPVIAAGGMADGRGVAAAYMLGASGVQMGTRFLASEESEIHQNFKDAVIKAKDVDTLVTGELIGNRARVLKTKMSKAFVKQERELVMQPVMDADAREKLENGSLRNAVIDGDKENGAFMAGQISGLVHEIKPVAQILDDIWTEAYELLDSGIQK